jgi:calcium-dependent protein kinase
MTYVLFHKYCRYITKDELEQALKEKGLYDAKDIKEVISDADTDNVRNNIIHYYITYMQNNAQMTELTNIGPDKSN